MKRLPTHAVQESDKDMILMLYASNTNWHLKRPVPKYAVMFSMYFSTAMYHFKDYITVHCGWEELSQSIVA